MTPRVLVVDNRDSFAFNLVEEFRALSADVCTLRGDVSLEHLQDHIGELGPDLVVLSPGPGHPEASGVMVPWLRTEPRIAVLGVCLGHQAIAVAAGGRLARVIGLVHGEAHRVDLEPDPVFDGLPSPFLAARYHSLHVAEVPAEIRVIATGRDGATQIAMALRHRRLPYLGVQFHPESILTPHGSQLLSRVLAHAVAACAAAPVPNPKR